MKGQIALLLVVVAAVSGLPRTLPPHGWERIVGGVVATPHEFPWMIDMKQGSHYCGGTLMNEEWVVTAAHCSTGSPGNYQLVAGDHNTAVDEGTEQTRQVVRIIRHPSYGSGITFESDIALMKVEPPFEFNEYVQPASIANASFLPTTRATVAGWGALTEGGGSPTTLYKVEVPVLTDAQCTDQYGPGSIADSMICAGEGGKDSCQGDSGGPMMCESDGEWHLCGIVSWGRGCARPDFAGVYTEVSYFEEWAREATMPPVDSNDTWVEQLEGCGGVLSGSSGYINYKAGQAYAPGEHCTWTIQAEDREKIRVRVRTSGLSLSSVVLVTELDFEKGTTTTTTALRDLENHVFSGPVIFLTFAAGTAGSGFDFEFYGTSFPGRTGYQFQHYHQGEETGEFSYPVGGGQYKNDAFATFVVNPAGAAVARLSVDRIDIESGCTYDWVQIHGLTGNGFTAVSERLCGTTPPTEKYESTEGVLLAVFKSDDSVTQTGFTYTYNNM